MKILLGKDRLANPNTWPDPLDNFLLRQTQINTSDGEVIDPTSLGNGWYAQCWSLQKNSAAMWHLYGTYKDLSGQGGLATINPQNYAQCSIQVSSTPRKILDHFYGVLENSKANLFCGYVRYIEEYEFENLLSRYKFADFLFPGNQRLFAEFMCLKRMAFSHEQEVRFIYQDINIDFSQPWSMYREYDLNPNVLFNGVVLDPRLKNWESEKIKNLLLTSGIMLNIQQSDLYERKLFQMPF
ncbi:hypothetical protein [Polynucleobacter sp. MG-28-Ekke-A2]|uniref:hypothetical protein n=1 Tax=Polynucleobacter sp. MG-28-Ekke-A2 TaxID=3108276 RepID=UPI002B23DA48|nr:hypothetical protein [Polynucleobacter sp. MG-28-Ekke-A2]